MNGVSGRFIICSNTFTRFTRSAAEEFHSHGDVAIPTPRLNAQVSRLNWWAEDVIHKTHTVAIGGEILGATKNEYTLAMTVCLNCSEKFSDFGTMLFE